MNVYLRLKHGKRGAPGPWHILMDGEDRTRCSTDNEPHRAMSSARDDMETATEIAVGDAVCFHCANFIPVRDRAGFYEARRRARENDAVLRRIIGRRGGI